MSLCTLQSVLDTLPSGWIVVGMKTFPIMDVHLPPGRSAYAIDLRNITNGEMVSSYEFTPDDAWKKACDIARSLSNV